MTPTFGASWAAESTRIEEFAFKITPEMKGRPVNMPELRDVKIGTAVRDAIIAKYNDLLKMPVAPKGSTYGPPLTPQSFTMTFNFVAQQKSDGKVEIKFVPSSPTFTEVDPTLSTNREKTLTNQLVVSLPFDTDDPGDPRRLFYAVKGAQGVLYVEEPFSKERYDQLLTNVQKPKIVDGGQPPQWLLENLNRGLGPVPFNGPMVVPVPAVPESGMVPEKEADPF